MYELIILIWSTKRSHFGSSLISCHVKINSCSTTSCTQIYHIHTNYQYHYHELLNVLKVLKGRILERFNFQVKRGNNFNMFPMYISNVLGFYF